MKETFGIFVREKRESLQLSVRGFARQIDISAVYLSKIENGLRPAPKDDIVERIADRLALSQIEREILLDLAAESKAYLSLASDLIVYINENKVIHKILRIGKSCKVDSEDWQKILDYLSNKYL